MKFFYKPTNDPNEPALIAQGIYHEIDNHIYENINDVPADSFSIISKVTAPPYRLLIGINTERHWTHITKNDSFFYRGTNNPHELNLLLQGKLKSSINYLSGDEEAGISVSETFDGIETFFAIIYKVSGTPISNIYGSDGEPLLDLTTIKLWRPKQL
jgi:hypothetical protein